MSLNVTSSAQYGKMPSSSDYASAGGKYGSPITHSASTYGSVGSKTAWTTSGIGHGTPLSYSKRTGGSVLKWDDDNGAQQLPQSDPGSPYALNRG